MRWACVFALAMGAALGGEDPPPTWTPQHQQGVLERAAASGALKAVLTTRGFRDPERGEVLLVRGERVEGLLRGTLELRTVGGMREERLVLQSDVRLEDGAFVALRFLLVRGAMRVRGEAQVEGKTLKGSVTRVDGERKQPAEPFERPWDPSAQPLSWVLGVLAPLRDAALPARLTGRIYHGVEQALAPEVATLSWEPPAEGGAGVHVLSLEGGLPGGRVARAGVKGGKLAWLELGDGGRALPLAPAELEPLIAAKPVGLE